MKYTIFTILSIILFITSCSELAPDADLLMKEAMTAHGVEQMKTAQVDFNFRGINYSVQRDGGRFSYHRYLTIDKDSIHDQLNNDGFSRFKNDTLLQVADSLAKRYRSSLNSVVYFAQLPYGLDGDAVNKRFVKKDTILGNVYNEIEVTFNKEGGGEDPDDVFLYWINEKTKMIDYLAYSFCEEECGYRFRQSINRRTINGIVVQDYNNFKTDELDPELSQLDEMFENEYLTKVSTIELRRVEVKN